MCPALIGSVLAYAQQPAPEDTTLVMLEEMVVSANRIPELRSKVAQQVEVLSGEEIRRMSMQSTADLVANSGVATVQKSQQGGGSPQLRGFEASRVVLVVDGVRMNNLIYRAGHLQNVITLDNNALERAEVLLGPSSTVYGSDALGGVIHFITRSPTLRGADDEGMARSGSAWLRYGTVNNEKTGHFDLNLGGKRLGSLTSFTISDFGDLKMGKQVNPALGRPFGLREKYVQRATDDELVDNPDPYVQRFSGYTQYDLLQKFLYKPSDRVSHLLNAQFSTSSDIPRYDRLTDLDDATGLRNAEWYYGPQRRLMVAYQLAIADLGSFADHLQATLSFQDVEESRHTRRFNNPVRSNQVENVSVLGLTVDFQKHLKRGRIRYGTDIQRNRLNSTAHDVNIVSGERTDGITRYPDGENRMEGYSLYATHTGDLSERLTITEGLRIGVSSLYSRFDDKTFFPFPFNEVKQNNEYASGNAGVIYRPTEDWKFAFMASTGYRVPNVDDLSKVFDTNAGTALVVPNPNVKPEKTFNLDFSVARFLFDRVRWEATFYHTTFFDAIVMDSFTFNGESTIDYQGQPTPVVANQNKRRARIIGFSSVLHAEIAAGLKAQASVNLSKGRIASEPDDLPLDHIPPTFGRVSVSYERAKLSAELFVNYNGWKHIEDYFPGGEDNERYAPAEGMPAWYTFNLRLGCSLSEHASVQAGIDNLFDLQYRAFASGINAPGRNFFITARLGF